MRLTQIAAAPDHTKLALVEWKVAAKLVALLGGSKGSVSHENQQQVGKRGKARGRVLSNTVIVRQQVKAAEPLLIEVEARWGVDGPPSSHLYIGFLRGSHAEKLAKVATLRTLVNKIPGAYSNKALGRLFVSAKGSAPQVSELASQVPAIAEAVKQVLQPTE